MRRLLAAGLAVVALAGVAAAPAAAHRPRCSELEAMMEDRLGHAIRTPSLCRLMKVTRYALHYRMFGPVQGRSYIADVAVVHVPCRYPPSNRCHRLFVLRWRAVR